MESILLFWCMNHSVYGVCEQRAQGAEIATVVSANCLLPRGKWLRMRQCQRWQRQVTKAPGKSCFYSSTSYHLAKMPHYVQRNEHQHEHKEELNITSLCLHRPSVQHASATVYVSKTNHCRSLWIFTCVRRRSKTNRGRTEHHAFWISKCEAGTPRTITSRAYYNGIHTSWCITWWYEAFLSFHLTCWTITCQVGLKQAASPRSLVDPIQGNWSSAIHLQ